MTVVNDMTFDEKLDIYHNQAKKTRAQSEADAEAALELRKSNGRIKNSFDGGQQRTMKCPRCNEYAESNGPGEPYICKCGWNSARPNGDDS